MTNPQDNNFDDEPPLSQKELARVREVLQADARAVWLWAAIKVWATWIAAILIAVTMGWDALKRLIIAAK